MLIIMALVKLEFWFVKGLCNNIKSLSTGVQRSLQPTDQNPARQEFLSDPRALADFVTI